MITILFITLLILLSISNYLSSNRKLLGFNDQYINRRSTEELDDEYDNLYSDIDPYQVITEKPIIPKIKDKLDTNEKRLCDGTWITATSCDKCKSDSECPNSFKCIHNGYINQCRRIPLFQKIDVYDYLAGVLVFIASSMVAGAGMGGGGLFVQIYLQCAALSPDESIPLAQSTILGGAIANLIANSLTPHPHDPNRCIIDFHTLLILIPMILVGTMFGVFVQVMSPTWLILILIVVMLSYSGYITGVRAKVMWKEENKAIEDAELEIDEPGEEDWLLTNGQSIKSFDYMPAPDSLEAEVEEMKKYESSKMPIIYLFALFVITTLFTIIRGGHPKKPSVVGVNLCTSSFWFWTLLQVVSLIIFSIPFGRKLHHDYEIKRRCNLLGEPGELQWTQLNIILYPILSVATGFFGGMLGLGGAIFSNPMLIALGMLPSVVIPTSATAILLSAAVAVLNSILMDILILDYAIFFGAISMVGTTAGIYFFAWLLRKYNRKSILLILICVVSITEAFLLFILGIFRLKHDIETSQHLTFVDFCEAMLNKK